MVDSRKVKTIPGLAVAVMLWATATMSNPWTIPLPHVPGTPTPERIQLSDKTSSLVLSLEGVERPLHGQWHGRQQTAAGLRASGLVFKVTFGDLPENDIRLKAISLDRETAGWQLEIGSIEMGQPHYHLHISDLSWRWNEQGYWHFRTGTLRLRVPLQTPVTGSRDATWRLFELVNEGLIGQGNQSGWQLDAGLTRLALPTLTQGAEAKSPTHHGRGRVEPVQMATSADGRFSIANSGGQVDRSLVSWLLGSDIGSDLRMEPLAIKGIMGTSGEIRLRTRNLLPWLDLWFGEPGTAARHLKSQQVGNDAVMVIGD